MSMQRLVWCAFAGFVAIGCQTPAKLAVKPKARVITEQGGTLDLKIEVQDRSGKALSGQALRFTSLTPLLLSVDQDGKVKAIASGRGQVLVQAGRVERKVDVDIQIAARVGINPDSPILNQGVRKSFYATVYDEGDRAIITGTGVRWTTSDPTVATIDARGSVKTLKEGKAKITAYVGGINGSTELTVQHEKIQADGYLGHSK